MSVERWEGSRSQIKVTVSPGEMVVDGGEELDQGVGVVGAGLEVEHRVGLGTVVREGQRRCHRHPAPAEPVPQHGRLAPRGPTWVCSPDSAPLGRVVLI
jgi:hypothetical protein